MDADLVSQSATAQAPADVPAAQAPNERSAPSSSSSAAAEQHAPSDPQAQGAVGIDADVKDIVTNFSSWWGGFSKQTAQTFEAASKQVQSSSKQIMQAARSELERFEQSLEEAQKKATEESRAESREGEDDAGATAAAGLSGKGKGKARHVDADEAAAGHDDGTEESVATVDANGDVVGGIDPARGPGSPRTSTSDGAGFDLDRTIEQQLGRASALFSQFTQSVQNDPRVKNLQSSLANIGKSASTEVEGEKADGQPRTGDMLSNLSKTIQSNLPHLTWNESQALAEKYFHKSEAFAKEVVNEVRGLAEDLVQITPPEGKGSGVVSEKATEQQAEAIVFDAADSAPEEKTAAMTSPTKQTSASRTTPAAKATPERKTQQPDALQTSTLPPTGGWGESDDEATPTTATAPARDLSATAAKTRSTAGKKASERKGDDGDGDEDSDWE